MDFIGLPWVSISIRGGRRHAPSSSSAAGTSAPATGEKASLALSHRSSINSPATAASCSVASDIAV